MSWAREEVTCGDCIWLLSPPLPACLPAPCYSQLFWLISAPCLDCLLLGY